MHHIALQRQSFSQLDLMIIKKLRIGYDNQRNLYSQGVKDGAGSYDTLSSKATSKCSETTSMANHNAFDSIITSLRSSHLSAQALLIEVESCKLKSGNTLSFGLLENSLAGLAILQPQIRVTAFFQRIKEPWMYDST